jgi:hypothetical protein
MNIFDAIGKTTFDVCRAVFGYAATWIRTNGPEMSSQVLYQYPGQKVELDGSKFTLENYQFEFYETDFPGLKESVQDANNERVKIETTPGVFQNFIVKRCEPKGDGRTVIAQLNLID